MALSAPCFELTQTVALILAQSCLDSGAGGAHLPLVMGMGKQRNSISKENEKKIATQKKQDIQKASLDCYLILCLVPS